MAARWNLLTFDIEQEDNMPGGNADRITIESDERGFELHVETDEGDRYQFNIHGCAEQLWEQAVKRIGPWLLEGQAAKREYDTLDRIKRDPYEDEDNGPWPGESVLAFYQRTGNDEPLRDQADHLNKTRKEN